MIQTRRKAQGCFRGYEETARLVTEILVKAVEDGTGVNARLNGYRAAGKTGTAQKIEPNGEYSHTKFVASFIGFAPADDPVISIAVVLDEPRGSYYGGTVAAPVFKYVASELLKYEKKGTVLFSMAGK
ncbi:MAG: hypothetical protein HYV48_04925 [Candidatus Omnitrophica bacterium]|nr:hypothetical protein [Candidatus Omnitrophota bacterium]